MGVPKQQASRNRQAIVETASRVFRERGVDGVGVADLMKEAGFTHGGFYNHFESKDALAAEACASAFAAGAANIRRALEADAQGAGTGLRDLMAAYLSHEHCVTPANGCPTAALAVDAARQGKEMQAAYADGIETFITTMMLHFAAEAGSSEQARETAIAVLSGVVGAMVLARGVGAANPDLSEEILAVGRKRLAG